MCVVGFGGGIVLAICSEENEDGWWWDDDDSNDYSSEREKKKKKKKNKKRIEIQRAPLDYFLSRWSRESLWHKRPIEYKYKYIHRPLYCCIRVFYLLFFFFLLRCSPADMCPPPVEYKMRSFSTQRVTSFFSLSLHSFMYFFLRSGELDYSVVILVKWHLLESVFVEVGFIYNLELTWSWKLIPNGKLWAGQGHSKFWLNPAQAPRSQIRRQTSNSFNFTSITHSVSVYAFLMLMLWAHVNLNLSLVTSCDSLFLSFSMYKRWVSLKAKAWALGRLFFSSLLRLFISTKKICMSFSPTWSSDSCLLHSPFSMTELFLYVHSILYAYHVISWRHVLFCVRILIMPSTKLLYMESLYSFTPYRVKLHRYIQRYSIYAHGESWNIRKYRTRESPMETAFKNYKNQAI